MNVPDTSLSAVEAVLPVIVVLSMTTVPPARRSSPPPTPTPGAPAAPGLAGKATPVLPSGFRQLRQPRLTGARPPTRPSVGLVARDGIGGLELLDPFLAQPRLDGKGAGRRIEDRAAKRRTAGAAIAAVASEGASAKAAETSVAAPAALTEATVPAAPPIPAVGLVVREIRR